MARSQVARQQRRDKLEPAALIEIDTWLAPYRRLCQQRLDALESYLDEKEQGEGERRHD